MTKHTLSKLFFCSIVLFFALCGWIAPAQARPLDTGYSINLIYNGSTTISLGDATGSFDAEFYHASPLPSNGETADLYFDGHSYQGYGQYISPTQEQYYFGGVTDLTSGPHQFQAKYYLTTTSSWIISNTVTITVGKGNSNLDCAFENLSYTYAQGQSLPIVLTVRPADGNGTVDWQNSTFTISFTGPSTVNYPNLTANASEQVTVKAPQPPGQYHVTCTFNGSPNYKSSTAQLVALVSEQHKTGAIQLYTNPTTVRANQPTTYYVVIPAGNGLPTPTGSFDIIIGNASSRPIQLNATGSALVQLNGPTSVYGNITILYFGDAHYISETPTFPLTNPPIPAGGGTTPPPGATATPTPGATASVTATAGTTATPTAGAVSSPQNPDAAPTKRPSASPMLLGGLLALFLVIGLGSGIVLALRRKK